MLDFTYPASPVMVNMGWPAASAVLVPLDNVTVSSPVPQREVNVALGCIWQLLIKMVLVTVRSRGAPFTSSQWTVAVKVAEDGTPGPVLKSTLIRSPELPAQFIEDPTGVMESTMLAGL